MTEFWTIEKIDQLFAMVRDGHTFSAIGAVLGCSRNACIGKYNHVRVARGIHTRKPRPKVGIVGNMPRRRPQVADRVEMPALHAVVAAPRGPGVSIVDVTGCRFAIADNPSLPGGYAFCDAEPDKNGSYCAEHARIVYAKPPKPGTAKRFKLPVSLLRMGAR